MFAFEYHLLGSVGEEILIPALDLASDAIEIQFQQKTLVKAFEKSSRTMSV